MTGRGTLTALARRAVPRRLRNLLRSPATTARWLRDEGSFLLGRRRTLRVRPDWAVRCHPVSFASFARVAGDADLSAELDGFVAHAAAGMRLLDLGANYGFYCLAALRYGGPTATAVAVDPSATGNRILRDNLRLAGAGGRVRVIEAAAGAEDGTLPMLTTGPGGDHYLVAAPAGRTDVTRARQYSVPGLIALAGPEPTHVKVDVEGFEAEVVDGAAAFLRHARPVVFLELHGDMLRARGRDPADVLRRLADCGYARLARHGRPIAAADAAALPIARLVCTAGG